MTMLDIQVGKDYVIHVPKKGHRIGRVEGFGGNDRGRTVLVAMRRADSAYGGPRCFDEAHRKYGKPQEVSAANVVRPATPREVALAFAIHPVPEVGS